MRPSDGLGNFAAAAAAVGASLVFALCGPALAWEGDLQAEPLHGVRQAGAGRQPAAGTREIPAGKNADCGKCHSACEDGKIHEGTPTRALPTGVWLPQGKDGRTTCSTCHTLHGGDDAPGSAMLRMSNLRRELCLVCHDRKSDDEIRIRIVSPPPLSIVAEERLALIGTTSGHPGDSLAVRLNGATVPLPAWGDAFFTWLTLKEGVNRIEIVQRERLLWTGEVFRGEGAARGFGPRAVGHQTERREQCLECHEDNSGEIAGSAGDPSALCYGCHDRSPGKRYLHGPFAVGACLACHDAHGGYGTAHLREEQAALCGDCHAARETAATRACDAKDRECAACHDPHQSEARYLLRGPAYTMGGPAGR